MRAFKAMKPYKFYFTLKMVAKALTFFMGLSSSAIGFSQQAPRVLVMEIRDNIDPAMNRYVELAFNKADEINADHIIIDMDTYGGAVKDADDIRTRIMNYPKPVYVFINKDAASAGALISIACDSIYMAPGGSIGAATVVTGDGQAAPDKYQSYMRSIMRSTAEASGRDPKIAEAMVDQNLEIDGITKEGEVLTFSTSEAIKHGYCEGQVSSIRELLQKLNLEDAQVTHFELSTTEKIIAFFLNPYISSILILIIIGGLYFELQTPGVGFPILASFIAMLLYFIPYYLTGLAEHWEILIFFIGLILIAVEVFVIPGFGVAGISGIILTLAGLVLVMLDNDAFDFTLVKPHEIIEALAAVLAGILGSILFMFIIGVRFTESSFFKRIALIDVQDREEGYSSHIKHVESMVGKTGTAYTVLRPSGKVLIDNEIYDAYTRGNYIAQGTSIIVVDDSGSSLKVKELE
jgi:membrane-bound serine protease (ClpP class)